VNAIEFEAVSKAFPVYDSPGDRLKELLVWQWKSFHRQFWALREVSFAVRRGETLSIIGENGAGKSTLLELVAGILRPTAGTAAVTGRVSALLELGSGFDPEYTGRENVYVNAAVLGFTRRQTEDKLPQIEEFADIGEFLDRPVKTYSSGMVVRLGFAVAIHTEPEILLVDEALAVGDTGFRQRCLRKVHELRSRGVTILLVSHSMADVQAVGDRALWLDAGRVRQLGETQSVVANYLEAMARKDAAYLGTRGLPPGEEGRRPGAPQLVEGVPNIDHRSGDGGAEVIGIAVLDPSGRPLRLIEPGSRIIVRISARARRDLRRPVIGFLLRNHLGIDFAGTNSARERLELPPLAAGDVQTVDFHLELPELYPAFFSISPAIADGEFERRSACDWIDNAITVQVSATGNPVYGYIHLPCRVELNAATAEGAHLD
jgi:ABC-type polysaccharide/polyol phosphate transport system ATPase subunit